MRITSSAWTPTTMLDARYVAACQQALDAQPGRSVAYTGLGILAADGSVQPNAWPPSLTGTRRPSRPTRRRTGIPCAAMFRKALWT